MQVGRGLRSNLAIVGSVLLLHGGALWALQSGLLRRAIELVVPVEVLSSMVELPRPKTPPPKPAEPTRQLVASPRETRAPAPLPLAIADPTPAPNAPTGVVSAPPTVSQPVVATAAPVAAVQMAAPSKVELPSSDADYLHNPKPEYPALSKRKGEQGKVVVHTLIGVDGVVQKAEIRQTSGFERLDQAALATVQRWRFVPGKRGGVPEPMWFNVPINFVLE
jgi:periplasmic protein TonB